jgi:hypothetical protein
MERETGIEPATSSLGKRSSIVNKGLWRSWRSTQCIEIHGVSSGLVETRLNALIAFLKPGMLWLSKTNKESFRNHLPNARWI